MAKTSILYNLTDAQKRALGVLAGLVPTTLTGELNLLLFEGWQKQFPGMDYPDDEGKIKPLEVKE